MAPEGADSIGCPGARSRGGFLGFRLFYDFVFRVDFGNVLAPAHLLCDLHDYLLGGYSWPGDVGGSDLVCGCVYLHYFGRLYIS